MEHTEAILKIGVVMGGAFALLGWLFIRAVWRDINKQPDLTFKHLNPVHPFYRLTSEMVKHIRKNGGQWHKYQMTQDECLNKGFLSGDRGTFYCYNDIVERCGDVIKFRNNTVHDSSVNTRYSWLK